MTNTLYLSYISLKPLKKEYLKWDKKTKQYLVFSEFSNIYNKKNYDI